MKKIVTAAWIVGIAISLGGCDKVALQCPEWVKKTMPIKPSRQDNLTPGTQNQIIAANENWEANCR